MTCYLLLPMTIIIDGGWYQTRDPLTRRQADDRRLDRLRRLTIIDLATFAVTANRRGSAIVRLLVLTWHLEPRRIDDPVLLCDWRHLLLYSDQPGNIMPTNCPSPAANPLLTIINDWRPSAKPYNVLTVYWRLCVSGVLAFANFVNNQWPTRRWRLS